MASEKNPSIYDDRGAIGSSEELDEYGVWVKSGPQDISEGFQDNGDDGISVDLSRDFSLPAQDELPDFVDFSETDDADDAGAPAAGFEAAGDMGAGEEDQFIDIDIPEVTETGETVDFGTFDETETDTQGPADDAGISFEEIEPGENGELNFEDIDGSPEPAPGQDGNQESARDFEIDFGDGDAFPETPAEEPPESGQTAGTASRHGAAGGEDASVSTQLLFRIVNELSSIKSELSSLKKELSATRGEAPQAESDGQEPGGFFDEADDEKIALTGAEMDNILSTASFTEEAGGGGDSGAGIGETGIQGEALPAAGEAAVETGAGELGGAGTIPFGEEALSEDIPGLPEDLAGGPDGELSVELPDDFSIEDSEAPGGESDELPMVLLSDSDTGVPGLADDLSMEDYEAPGGDSAGPAQASDDLPMVLLSDSDTGVPGLADDFSMEDFDVPGEESGGPAGESDELPMVLLSDSDTGVPGLPDEPADAGILPQDVDLPLDGIVLDEEAGDLDLDANLSLDFPSEDEEKAAGASEADDSFARLIPEGYEEKAAETPFRAGEPPGEDDIFDTGILSEDETLGAELSDEDISAGTGESAGLDAVFDLSPEPGEGAPEDAIEIPEISLDLGAEFDTDALAAEEDMTIDIPADTEGGEETAGFDFAEEAFEPLDLDTEDLSLAEQDLAEDEALPDIALEAEPAVELPVEDESLSAEFDEFSVETPEAEIPEEPAPKAAAPKAAVPKAAVPEAAKAGVPGGSTLANVPEKIREELKTVLAYMDQLLESLPEEKIEEFAKSEYFDTYKKLFEDLGLV
ncbi:MAG: hypothetical protein LBH15_05140 [Treponema sp.]|jgi:hypothetical protein|nr:hypothetical protein [Treponema sp.]